MLHIHDEIIIFMLFLAGKATRKCSRSGWFAVDKTACISYEFVDIKRRMTQLENGELTMNPWFSKNLISDLADATNRTASFGRSERDASSRY